MALKLTAQAPETAAVVTVRPRNLFHPRSGVIKVSGNSHPYEIQIVAPNWKKSPEALEADLARCYWEILNLAQRKRWSIALPLLSAETPRFPQHRDYSIAHDILQTFAAAHEDIDVYLILSSRPPHNQNLRKDLDKYMDQVAREVQKELRTEAKRQQALRQSEDSDLQLHEDILLPPDLQEEPVFLDYGMCLPPSSATCHKETCSPIPLSFQEELEERIRKADRIRPEEADEGFLENLFRRIDESGMKDSVIYTRANISRQLFSKMQSKRNQQKPYKPTKATALAFAVALELDLEQTRDLIRRAGYELNNHSKFDIIVTFYIEKKHYRVSDINLSLWEFDQPLLGSSKDF